MIYKKGIPMRGLKYEVNNCPGSSGYGGSLFAIWWAPYFVFSLAICMYDATRDCQSSWCWLDIRQRFIKLFDCPHYNI